MKLQSYYRASSAVMTAAAKATSEMAHCCIGQSQTCTCSLEHGNVSTITTGNPVIAETVNNNDEIIPS